MENVTPTPRKQFIASRSGELTFPGARTKHVGGLTVHHSVDLPTTPVDIGGDSGLLVGWPLHLDGRSALSRAEAQELGGRWLFISESAVLHDALGSYGVVFSPDLEVVASSTGLIDESLLAERVELNRFLNLPFTRNWYPFGLTPYKNFQRLLPNHILDLQTWEVARTSGPIPSWSTEECVEILTDGFVRSMDAIKSSPVMLGVTGGNETRMLLAGLRGADDVYSFTFGSPRTPDAVAARALAQITGFRHEMIPMPRSEAESSGRWIGPDARASARWFDATGRCVTGETMRHAGAKTNLPSDRLFVKGLGGEIGRGTYFEPDDAPDDDLSASELLDRLSLPPHPDLVAAAEQWMARLSPLDAFELLDDLYMDIRMGAWNVPQLHADVTAKAMVFPFNKASIVAASRALPVEMRRTSDITTILVTRLWPELLKVPINKPPMLKGLVRRAERLVKATRTH